MLDIVIANGTVVTSQGAGAWEVGIQGERIAALGLPGSLPRDGARVIDAAGTIVVPGGIDPHTHLAHAIMSHPDQPSATLGPEDDTPRHGVRRDHHAYRLRLRAARAATSRPPSSSGRRAGRATPTSTTRSTSRCAALST